MAFFDLFNKLPSSIVSRVASSRIGKVWQLFSEKADEVKSLQMQMRMLRSINDAEGKLLDLIGDIVGETRDGRDDAEYRLFIKIAIAKNNSSGSIPEIIEIARTISGNQAFLLNELFEAADEHFFDAEGFFDGQSTFSPGLRRDRAFEIEFEGPIQTLQIPKNLAKAINQIRSGGIFAKVRAIFNATATPAIAGIRSISAEIATTAAMAITPHRSIACTYSAVPINDSPSTGLMDGQSLWDASGFFSGTSGIAPTGHLTITEQEV